MARVAGTHQSQVYQLACCFGKNSSCFARQEKGLPDLLKWAWARRGNPSTGGLINHPRPSPADFARAFPIAPANYTAMASPPGAQSVSELQRAQSCAKKH